jgi:nucleotide-binding universal stress UspA family protein
MYRKIFVPLDGSTISEGIVPHARFFSRALELPVEFLHVIDPAQRHPYAVPAQAREYLEKIAGSFAGMANPRCTVLSGNPPAEIVDLAAAQPGALIAMATHGYTGPKRWLIGSNAERVLHAAANHLLLVRPREEEHGRDVLLKTVLVPLDGSDAAEKALPVVAEIAVRLQLEVVLLRVLKPVYTAPPEAILPVFGVNTPNLKQLWEEDRLAAERYLNDKVEALHSRGVINASSLVLVGGTDGAAAEIIELAKQTPHHIIAMTTHGESALARWMIGSVTQRVVRHSSGPVLVIR